ncbi:hypothetical protein HY968_03440 [Candidatus Kaiserbacteria bacterium]|nr:hypothetical protein [Candidatus Kaiserbacteria bacterium]
MSSQSAHKAPGSNEFGLPQTAIAAAKSLGIPFYAIPESFWLQITSQDDLKMAETALAKS